MVSPPGTSSGAAPLGQEDTWNQGFEISYPKTSMATCFPQRQWGPQGATTVFHPFSRLQSPPPHIAISLGSPGAGMGASDRQALGPPPSSLCQLEQNLFCWIQRNPPPQTWMGLESLQAANLLCSYLVRLAVNMQSHRLCYLPGNNPTISSCLWIPSHLVLPASRLGPVACLLKTKTEAGRSFGGLPSMFSHQDGWKEGTRWGRGEPDCRAL